MARSDDGPTGIESLALEAVVSLDGAGFYATELTVAQHVAVDVRTARKLLSSLSKRGYISRGAVIDGYASYVPTRRAHTESH